MTDIDIAESTAYILAVIGWDAFLTFGLVLLVPVGMLVIGGLWMWWDNRRIMQRLEDDEFEQTFGASAKIGRRRVW